jgi:hypothetical protein
MNKIVICHEWFFHQKGKMQLLPGFALIAVAATAMGRRAADIPERADSGAGAISERADTL